MLVYPNRFPKPVRYQYIFIKILNKIPNRFWKPVRNITYYSAVITIVAGFNPFALAVNSNRPDLVSD